MRELVFSYMARAGGEADKLGNRYEGIWTVDSLLNVFTGEAASISIEPFGGVLGVEFVVRSNDGAQEFHSVKRQTTRDVWSLKKLTETGTNGRSILGDLFEKITADKSHRAAFVSTTTANQLEAIRAAAQVSPDSTTFEQRLTEQPRLREAFQSALLPLLSDLPTAWDALRRLRVVGFTEPELTRRIDQRIQYTLYRPDGALVSSEAVRLALADAALSWLGAQVNQAMIQDYLTARGWRERNWQRDTTLREHVARRNNVYANAVEAELINGAAIPRRETEDAIGLLTTGNEDVVLVGAAGLGKSCVVAQVIHGLEERSIPHLTLRLDVQTTVLSADALGKELGLPISPTIVLAGLSQGGRCVLAIDQLDALSLVSGRNQHLWNVFEELLGESRRYPQMRVLLACREFDAANDHRLKRLISDETRCKKIALVPLSAEQVAMSVQRTGIDPAQLSAHDLTLLQTPQNLSLFLQSGPQEHGQVGSVQALLNRYWNYKQRRVEHRLGRPVRWLEVVKALANWLSEHQTLSAPVDILDAFMSDAQAMASEHVLVIEGKFCRFFHESVFDYVFARTYVAQGGSAANLLLQDDQHLFRRAQVRQILTYNRDRSFEDYLTDLQRLLAGDWVRAHLKKLVIDWLRSLPDPRLQEWQLVQSCAGTSPVSKWWFTVPHGGVGWFDLLLQCGTWQEWLSSADETRVRNAIWLLSQSAIMRERSEKVAELFEPLIDGSPRSIERLRSLLRFSEPHHSRRMFEFFLRALREGWLDDSGDHWWHHLHDFPDKAPREAAELLAAFVERQLVLRPDGDPFPTRAAELHFPADYCSRLAKAAPEDFISLVLPRIASEVTRRAIAEGNPRDHIWRYTSIGELHDFGESLLGGLSEAAANLAKETPDRFKALTDGVLRPVSHSLGIILLRGWTANPVVFANECAQYLSQDNSRLRIGYDITSRTGGYGPGYLSRLAIQVISPHCSVKAYAQLEAAVLAFRSSSERGQDSGYTQIWLLANLPSDRLGTVARSRLDALRRKFPIVRDAQAKPPAPLKMELVPSPIAPESMPKMSIENWISAMRIYNADHTSGRARLRGGMHTLGTALKHQVQKDRPRYASMILSLPDDINPVYFDDIVYGLVDDQQDDAEGKCSLLPVEMDALVAVIQRMHALPGRPCGRSICHAISRAATRAVPDELLAVLSEYAISDPDPAEEDWLPPADGSAPMWGGDPMSSGMNSGRGAAAWAIGSVLFAVPSAWEKMAAAVRHLVTDESIAVRSCVVRCLLALLNVDRTLAVELFLQLVDGAEPVLGCGEVDNFIHHGIYPHYPKLRPLLVKMLKHPDKTARETAAEQITVAAFNEIYGGEDLALAMSSGAECRAACAGVFAHNLRDTSVGAVCREKLKLLFHDGEKGVREEAAGCFRGLGQDLLISEVELIRAYIQSPAFADGINQLMYALDESSALLPDVICAIPEKVIELQSTLPDDTNLRHCYQLPELVLRLYRQTSDSSVKRRCLDTIDRMLEFGIGDIDSELRKVER